MYTADSVSLEVFADDYERYEAFCRLYKVSLMDGLSVLMDLASVGSTDDLVKRSLKSPDFVFDRSVELSSEDVRELEREADEGGFLAMLDLGYAHIDGRLPWNPEKAYLIACRAADSGNPEALYLAGTSAYLCGKYDNAFSWFEMGASMKHTDSEFMLGMCYALGHGCSVDKEKAEALLTRAHKKGSGLVDTAEKVFGKIE